MHLGLLLMRNTPRDNNLKSPAKRLLSKTTNILLPTTDVSLKPQVVPNVSNALEKARLQKKTYYDKNARSQSQLHPGETVRIHEGKFERAGIVTGQGPTSRSYIVQTDSGIYHRNRRNLWPSHIPTPSVPQVRIVPDKNMSRPVPPPRNIPPPQPKTPPKSMHRTSKQPPLPQSTPTRPEENKF